VTDGLSEKRTGLRTLQKARAYLALHLDCHVVLVRHCHPNVADELRTLQRQNLIVSGFALSCLPISWLFPAPSPPDTSRQSCASARVCFLGYRAVPPACIGAYLRLKDRQEAGRSGAF